MKVDADFPRSNYAFPEAGNIKYPRQASDSDSSGNSGVNDSRVPDCLNCRTTHTALLQTRFPQGYAKPFARVSLEHHRKLRNGLHEVGGFAGRKCKGAAFC